MIIGLILVAVGVIALLVKLGVLAGSIWGYSWPVILILLGLSWLWGSWGGRRPGRFWGWSCGCGFPREEDR